MLCDGGAARQWAAGCRVTTGARMRERARPAIRIEGRCLGPADGQMPMAANTRRLLQGDRGAPDQDDAVRIV